MFPYYCDVGISCWMLVLILQLGAITNWGRRENNETR